MKCRLKSVLNNYYGVTGFYVIFLTAIISMCLETSTAVSHENVQAQSIRAFRIEESPVIDGLLDEPFCQLADRA